MFGTNGFSGLSIRSAFLLIFALLLATPLAIFWTWPVARALEQEVDLVLSDRHLLLARNLGATLKRYHRDVVSTFEYFAAKPESDGRTEEAEQILSNLHFRHICLADSTTGKLITGFGDIAAKCPPTIPAKRFALFKSMAVEEKTVLSGVLPGPDGQPIIYLVRLAGDHMAIGALRTGYFVALGKTIAFGIKGHAAIVDQHGKVLAHPLPSWIAAMKDMSKVSAVQRMLGGETGVEIFYSPALKDDMIAGFTTVEGPGWGVMIPQPVSELRHTLEEIQSSVLAVFAVGMLIALIVSPFAAIPILRPLSAVIRGAKRMENGETDVRLDVSGKLVPRELRTLLTSFNSMAENILSAHRATEESEKNFRNIIEGSIQGVFIVSDWRLLFANQALADIFGYETPEEILAVGSAGPLIAPEERDRILGYKRARENGEYAPEVYEAKGLRKDGEIIWVEFRVREVEWHGRTAFQCVVVDITERKNAEGELIRHRDHLQEMVDTATGALKVKAAELQKALAREKELNELQRQFVSMASHEFRTPLSVIDGTAQRLKRLVNKGALSPEDAVERIDKIRGAVGRMTRLMESTLTATRMDEGKIEIEIAPCNIRGIVEQVCAQQQEIAQDHVISWEVTALPETIQADSGALEQVLTNLLSNAVKYAPDSPDIEVKGQTRADHVEIVVHDHGIGIDEDDLPRMFERFFRAKSSTGIAGTGIGLNVVKMLIEMHDGSINVKSAIGQGSTFTVRLPMSGPDQTDQADQWVA